MQAGMMAFNAIPFEFYRDHLITVNLHFFSSKYCWVTFQIKKQFLFANQCADNRRFITRTVKIDRA